MRSNNSVDIDWRSLPGISTPEIVRGQKIADDDGAGILWSSDIREILVLSALGVLAWEGHAKLVLACGSQGME